MRAPDPEPLFYSKVFLSLSLFSLSLCGIRNILYPLMCYIYIYIGIWYIFASSNLLFLYTITQTAMMCCFNIIIEHYYTSSAEKIFPKNQNQIFLIQKCNIGIMSCIRVNFFNLKRKINKDAIYILPLHYYATIISTFQKYPFQPFLQIFSAAWFCNLTNIQDIIIQLFLFQLYFRHIIYIMPEIILYLIIV